MCAKNLSNEEMTKIKVIDIHELNNFCTHHFLCWNQFGSQILVSFFKISNLKCSNFVKWQDDQNKSCISWWVEQLLYSSLLHLKSFRVLKFGLNLSNFKFQISNFKMCKTLSHPNLIKLKCWSMILEIFKKKPSHLKLVWGRTTSYKVYPQIKKRNYTVLDDPYMIIVNSVISFFNLLVNFVTNFSFSY